MKTSMPHRLTGLRQHLLSFSKLSPNSKSLLSLSTVWSSHANFSSSSSSSSSLSSEALINTTTSSHLSAKFSFASFSSLCGKLDGNQKGSEQYMGQSCWASPVHIARFSSTTSTSRQSQKKTTSQRKNMDGMKKKRKRGKGRKSRKEAQEQQESKLITSPPTSLNELKQLVNQIPNSLQQVEDHRTLLKETLAKPLFPLDLQAYNLVLSDLVHSEQHLRNAMPPNVKDLLACVEAMHRDNITPNAFSMEMMMKALDASAHSNPQIELMLHVAWLLSRRGCPANAQSIFYMMNALERNNHIWRMNRIFEVLLQVNGVQTPIPSDSSAAAASVIESNSFNMLLQQLKANMLSSRQEQEKLIASLKQNQTQQVLESIQTFQTFEPVDYQSAEDKFLSRQIKVKKLSRSRRRRIRTDVLEIEMSQAGLDSWKLAQPVFVLMMRAYLKRKDPTMTQFLFHLMNGETNNDQSTHRTKINKDNDSKDGAEQSLEEYSSKKGQNRAAALATAVNLAPLDASYECYLESFAQQDDTRNLVRVFNQLANQKILVWTSLQKLGLYKAVLRGFVKTGDIPLCDSWVVRIVDDVHILDDDICCQMIDLHASQGKLHRALGWFNRMEANHLLYPTGEELMRKISAYEAKTIKNNRKFDKPIPPMVKDKHYLPFLLVLKYFNDSPNLWSSSTSSLNAAATHDPNSVAIILGLWDNLVSRMVPNLVAFESTLYALAFRGKITQFQSIWDQLERFSVVPSCDCYTAQIIAYSNAGDFHHAFHAYTSAIENTNVQLNSKLFVAVIRACGQSLQQTQLIQVVEDLQSRYASFLPRDLNILMQQALAWIACTSLQEALDAIDLMELYSWEIPIEFLTQFLVRSLPFFPSHDTKAWGKQILKACHTSERNTSSSSSSLSSTQSSIRSEFKALKTELRQRLTKV